LGEKCIYIIKIAQFDCLSVSRAWSAIHRAERLWLVAYKVEDVDMRPRGSKKDQNLLQKMD